MYFKCQLPIHTMAALIKKEVWFIACSLGPYVCISLSLMTSSFFLINTLHQIKENSIWVSSDPMNFPLYISLIVVSFYLAILSSITISREKDHGTLEVLFYGPVNVSSFIIAKFAADLIVFMFLLAFLILYFSLVAALTHLALSWNLARAIILSIFSACCVVSFSIFISSLTSTIRNSVILLIATLMVFLSAQFLQDLFIRLNDSDLSQTQLVLRGIVITLNHAFEWISPFAYLNKGMQSIALGNILPYFLNILFSMGYTLFFLGSAIFVLGRKGVRE